MAASLLQIEEPRSTPELVGIAKLAATGESLRLGHDVEYFTLPARSLLNRCVSRMKLPFTWTINPYRGCEFACKYCYARYTHEFMEMRDGMDFERKIYVKQQTAWLLRQELKKVKRGEQIAMGTATDPYQPAEKRFEVTRGILEEMARHRGLELSIVTKSDMVVRDIDLLREVAQHNGLYINVTVTTADAKLARILEPRAPRPDLRLQAVSKLVEAGLNAGVICSPVLPGITDSTASLEGVVRGAKEAGARYVYSNALFLKPSSASVFLPFLEKEFPQLVESYRKRYERGAFVSKAYRERLAAVMSALRRKHGMKKQVVDRGTVSAEYRAEEVQMAMFG
ncbi:MAG TPA: radical SAM protein [Candidatus Angelobacter sp.]|nr:radical SAM protein [Candidatus Angelobacter sp.]